MTTSAQRSNTVDVLIAGAGPVGLFLACELRLAVCLVRVLEQADDPHSPLKQLPFGMRGLSVPTLEAFYRRGLLDEISAPLLPENASGAAPGAHWKQQPRGPGGHFAGIQFFHDRIDASRWPYRLPGPVGTTSRPDWRTSKPCWPRVRVDQLASPPTTRIRVPVPVPAQRVIQ